MLSSRIASGVVATMILGCAPERDTRLPTDVSVGERSVIMESSTFAQEFRSLREMVRPIVRIHSEAMRELRSDIAATGKAERTCQRSISLARKYGDIAKSKGARLSNSHTEAAIQNTLGRVSGCLPYLASGFSSFQATQPIFRFVSNHAVDEPFGETYDLYYGVITSVMYDWDGESDLIFSVDSAVNAMAFQYPLYYEESVMLAALVEQADVSLEDAEEAEYPDSVMDTYEIGSIFSANRWPGKTIFKKIAQIVLEDVEGFAQAFLPYWVVEHDENDFDLNDALLVGTIGAVGKSADMTQKCIADESPCKTQK